MKTKPGTSAGTTGKKSAHVTLVKEVTCKSRAWGGHLPTPGYSSAKRETAQGKTATRGTEF